MDYVQNKWIMENTIEKREYQEKIVETAIKANTLCVLPTAMGKTIIALLVVARLLDKNKKILFLAPTRPLVDQHKNTFEKALKLGLNLVAVTGKIDPEKRKELYRLGDIIFATPQCIKNDSKNGILSFENFSLLIVDEAQHSVGNYAYTYIASKFMRETKSEGLILGLTASPSGKYSKIYEIKRNLFIKQVEIRSDKDYDVKPFVKPISINWVEVELSPELENIRKRLQEMRNEKIEMLMKWGVIHYGHLSKKDILDIQKRLAKVKKGISFAAISVLAEIIKIDYAIELLETQTISSLKEYLNKIIEQAKEKKSRADIRLASDKRLHEIMNEANKIETHPKLTKLKEIVEQELKNPSARIMIFAQFRSTVKRIKDVLENIQNCKPVVLVGQRGEDGLRQQKQIELIRLYDAGTYNTLITTSIGEEGIHLGSATTAIFFEPVPSEIRTIQRRGRVGRERPGKIFILMTKKTRDQAYFWSAHHKEKKMINILERMKKQPDLKTFSE
ncbi:MAG: DEAD/DEAH box helicase [Candidatus Aenigmatarchaeota archaeon]